MIDESGADRPKRKAPGTRTREALGPVASPAAVVVATPEQLEAVVKHAVEEALAELKQEVRPLLLDRTAIAQALGIGTTSVDRFRKAGMPFIRLGESPRYLVEECIAWLRENQRGGLAAATCINDSALRGVR